MNECISYYERMIDYIGELLSHLVIFKRGYHLTAENTK